MEELGVGPRAQMDSGHTESPDCEFGWQTNGRTLNNKKHTLSGIRTMVFTAPFP